MRRGYKVALVSFVVALPLLMAPTGGFPTRPRLSSLGVNAAVPAGNGNVTASGTITGATINATSALQIAGVPLAAGFSGATVRKTAGQTGLSSAGTLIPVSWDAELIDTGSFHDNVTNNSRVLLPTQTGFAQCSLNLTGSNATTTNLTASESRAYICINSAGSCSGGSTVVVAQELTNSYDSGAPAGSFPPTWRASMVSPILQVTGGDYAEAFVLFSGYSANTNAVNLDSANSNSAARFSCWAVK